MATTYTFRGTMGRDLPIPAVQSRAGSRARSLARSRAQRWADLHQETVRVIREDSFSVRCAFVVGPRP